VQHEHAAEGVLLRWRGRLQLQLVPQGLQGGRPTWRQACSHQQHQVSQRRQQRPA
jgi:hypothetical protein